MPRSRKQISRKRKQKRKHTQRRKQRGGWTPEEFISLPDLGPIYDELYSLLQPRPDSMIHEPIPNLDTFTILAHGQIVTPEEKEYPDFSCDNHSSEEGLSEAYKSTYPGSISYLHVNGHVINEALLMDCAQQLFLDTFYLLYVPAELIGISHAGKKSRFSPPYLLYRTYKTLFPTKQEQAAAFRHPTFKAILSKFPDYFLTAPAFVKFCNTGDSDTKGIIIFSKIAKDYSDEIQDISSKYPSDISDKVVESKQLFIDTIITGTAPTVSSPLKASLEAQPNPVRALLITITAAYLRVKIILEKYMALHSREDEIMAYFAARGWSQKYSDNMTDPAYEAIVVKTINDYTRICYGLNALFHQVLREKLDGLFTSLEI
jgi:hypothetical protein